MIYQELELLPVQKLRNFDYSTENTQYINNKRQRTNDNMKSNQPTPDVWDVLETTLC